ncbi:hypothetical protein DES53_12521 [Roseimicrobium gellanilyticum]|uniref:Uncharacterized protein n=1 Tax=Roseimicrobium gellanilyticum TaxID=748857 RepID=A0A366H342_9BACT|nr:hypothetical protein DES53_12521 [Roseimicrobium gellanilyticum]
MNTSVILERQGASSVSLHPAKWTMKACSKCGGSGKVDCLHCYGSGNGYDKNGKCNYCHGSGRQTCYECDGSGRE